MPLFSPADYSGTIWPPVGIGLGAVLLWGNRVLPGIFIGDIGLKLAIYDISALQMAPSTLAIIVLMAVNGMFRAWLGVYLVKRYANYPNSLYELKDILLFFLFSSLVATFISSILNVSALYFLNLVQREGVILTTLSGWLADCMGGVIFTPLFLLVCAGSDKNWQRRRISVGLPLIILFIISVICFQFIKRQEEHRLHDVFRTNTQQFQTALEAEHYMHFEQLKFVKHFFETDEWVTEDEFTKFTQSLFFSGYLQQLKWITYAAHRKQNNGFSVKFHIKNTGQVISIKNDNRNLDLLTRFNKNNADIAYELDEENTQIVAYLPVFKGESLIGIVNAVFVLKPMVMNHLKTATMDDVFLQVRENDPFGTLLFQSEQPHVADNQLSNLVYSFYVNPNLHFLLLPSGELIQQQYSIIVWWASVAIMLVMTILTTVLLMLSGYAEVIKKQVQERTEALRVSNFKLVESETQFKELVQAQSAIVWQYDPTTQLYTFVSDEAEKLLGYPKSRWLTEVRFWESCIDPRDREWAVYYCTDKAKRLHEYDFDYRMISASGNIVWIRDIVSFKYDNEGNISQQLGIMIDISDQKLTEEKLRLAATTFDGLDGIMITDAQARILRVNHAFEEITGYTTTQAVGQKPSLLSSGENSTQQYDDLWQSLAHTGRYEGELLNRRCNGEVYPVWQRITAVTDEHNEITHYVSVFTDITNKKESELKIHQMAFYDSLTLLPNRRLLIDRLEKEVAVARRHEKFGALIFLDLDHFKLLNDSLGHHIGDELLIQMASRLKSIIRNEDSAVRLGGDEFVVLVHANANSLQEAASQGLVVAEKIQHAVNEKFILQSYQHHMSTSIGITLFPEEKQTISMILQQADAAMYQSKDRGRNRISYFHPSMQVAADAKLQLEKELRIAIEQEQFIICYQPQVDNNGELVSAEALVRWIHPDKGLIAPIEFIPVAEGSNLILSLGVWIIAEVCQQIKAWQLKGLEVKNIAINVSSKQFRQQDFVESVQQSLTESGISPQLIEIELTEGVVIDDIQDTVQKMQALKDLGVSIAIDDFGTGYSSLAYLKQLPLDVIKIDQSFIRDIMLDQSDAVIVETIIDMSHNLGLHTIAEGVETKEQYDYLSDKGCNMFQGYYFSRPLKAIDFYDRFGDYYKIQKKGQAHVIS